MSHVYAGDPHYRDVFAASLALTEGLTTLRRSIDGMIVNTIRGDGPKQTRNRPHVNEAPGHRIPPNGNAKQIPGSGRVTVPGRPAMPAQPTAGQRSNLPETEVNLVVPAQSTTGPPSESEPPRYPARPDPTDAAAEVWALVERAQAGESEAFGLI